MKVLAVDIGGTSTKVALVENEVITKRWSFATDKKNLWQNIKDNLTGLDWSSVDRIGVAMPGFINHRSGVVKLSGNLNLHDYDAHRELKKIFAKPTFVINDANAAALGEYWKGTDRRYGNMILYTIGTGIGGGVIINHELYEGKDGYAGEFGHAGNFQNSTPCTCGLPSCIEPVSSAHGMEVALHKNGLSLTLKDALSDAVQNGIDGYKIRKILKTSLTPLAYHIMLMQASLNPDAIFIGGGPSAQGTVIKKLIDELIAERQLPFLAASSPVHIASTRNDAGVYGAAYWAIKQGV